MADFEHPTESRNRNEHPDAQWFPDAGFGLFMHWGIHSIAGIQPSWAMIKDYPHAGTSDYPPSRYYALADKFNPTEYDPEKWLASAKKAGFRYAVLTTKHHDGYTLWPSQYGNLGTHTHMGGRDLVGEYVQACRNNGLKVGLYFSMADWNHPLFDPIDVDFDHNNRNQYPELSEAQARANFEEFYQFTKHQLKELLTNYGKIDLLWFDGVHWREDFDDCRGQKTIEWLRSLQPGMVINNRWGKVGDYVTPEGHFPETRPEQWWEMCDTTNGHWGYNPDKPLPDPTWFTYWLQKCRDWGGNFLANIGPSPDGTMPDDYYELCEQLSNLTGDILE